MAMAFSISVDLGELVQLDRLAEIGVFRNLQQSVQDVAEAGVERWQAAIMSAPGIWRGEAEAYAATVRARQLGAFEWEIVSDYKYVEDIERGRPARDLKVMLNTSMKVRVSAKGKRYLIIPMRHNTPGSGAHARPMPKAVYREARGLSASAVTGHGTRLSGTGAWDIKTKAPARVRARKYLWGDRLAAGVVPKMKKAHKTDLYAGMVRFKESSGGSTYMTFRVMSENSGGWIVPAKPGLWLAKTVAESLERTARIDFAEAVSRDINAG